jgi:hypothetical protein
MFTGSFELALLRCTQVYDAATDSVVFGDQFVPLQAFTAFSEYTLKHYTSVNCYHDNSNPM